MKEPANKNRNGVSSVNENRFTEILDQLSKESEGKGSLSEYLTVLEGLDETDCEVDRVPFPYGGNSDFGKWVTDSQSKFGKWKLSDPSQPASAR